MITQSCVPHVCVITPCHNHGNYIQNAITSVLTQDYANKSLIIVDDGSTDDSLLKSLQVLDITDKQEHSDMTIYVGDTNGTPCVVVSYGTAKKQAYARNLAIRLMWNGCDAFCQLDADDEYLSGKLSRSVAAWNDDQDRIGLVYSDAVIYDERDHTRLREFRQPYERSALERTNIISNAPLISKAALDKVGLYDEALPPCEDWDLWLRITECFMAVHVPEALQMYRVTGQNCTFTVTEDRWNEQRAIVQKKMMERRNVAKRNI